ncbi:MAG: hypothetical protein SP1CHLAM54_06010 [Chlamydiia bacterium]|nr:hypothetical protein [Chlamydiia bacterium]MCH9615511.1 hypothetical protein [Chlamydiia bacterium]MCH9629166.1 hypothetical protein [Chlamydiia bacterium]
MASVIAIGKAAQEVCKSLATLQYKCDTRFQSHRRQSDTHSEDLCWYQSKLGTVSMVEGAAKALAYFAMGPAAQVFSQFSATSIFQPEVTGAQHKVTLDQSMFQKRMEAGSKCSQTAKSVAEGVQGVLRELGRAHAAAAA